MHFKRFLIFSFVFSFLFSAGFVLSSGRLGRSMTGREWLNLEEYELMEVQERCPQDCCKDIVRTSKEASRQKNKDVQKKLKSQVKESQKKKFSNGRGRQGRQRNFRTRK